ncbi:MAG TPA: hypothetical protein GXX35_01120 [Thermoanaerobacterales bacterium]|nr:hypothetical protein [Thermoanaerobacterales bacterium]
MVKTFTGVDMSQYSIKPQDLGFDTEVSVEMSPGVTTKTKTTRAIAAQESMGTIRPNLMIYPGE